jgi:hypothetical protein
MGTGDPFPGAEARPGRDAGRAEAENEQELYSYPPPPPKRLRVV